MKNEKGIILITTLIIMAILLSTAIAFSVFIISGIKQASAVDNSIIAYYAAESGLEKSLFLLRKSDATENVGSLLNIIGDDYSLGNNSRWNIKNSSDYEASVFRQRLNNGQSVKLYFLEREDKGGLPASLQVEWRKIGTAKLETIFTRLKPVLQNGAVVYFSDLNDVQISDSEMLGTPKCYNFADREPGGNVIISNYAVEFRALGSGTDAVNSLRVRAFDNVDCAGSSNSQAITNITLKADGYFNQVRQEIIAHLPPRDPVSGLLGFVLFSEEDITKSY